MTSHNFISVKECAKLADVSDKTIRRWLRQFVEDPKHAHRDKFLPNAKSYAELRKKNKTAAWKIDADFFKLEKGITPTDRTSEPSKDSNLELIAILRDQLTAKDGQIERLQTTIDQSQKLHLSTQQAAGMLPEPGKEPAVQIVPKKRGFRGLFSR